MIAYAEAGVSGFVTCEESLADLVATIQRAAKGELVVLAAGGRRPAAAGDPARGRAAGATSSEEPLTPRELEVAFLLDEGLSNKQIAARLHLEVPTVKHHVHHILAQARGREPQRGGRAAAPARAVRHRAARLSGAFLPPMGEAHSPEMDRRSTFRWLRGVPLWVQSS